MTFSIIKRKTKTKIKFHWLGWSSETKFKFPHCLPFTAPFPDLAPNDLSGLISNILLPSHGIDTQRRTTRQPLTLTLTWLVHPCPAQHLLLPVLDRPLPSPGTWAGISLVWPAPRPQANFPILHFLAKAPPLPFTFVILSVFNRTSLFPTPSLRILKGQETLGAQHRVGAQKATTEDKTDAWKTDTNLDLTK